MDLPVALFVSVELDKRRQRVCKSNWPHVVHYPDVTKISERDVKELRDKHPRVTVMIAGGGFPCRDMSRLRGANRKGVQGAT